MEPNSTKCLKCVGENFRSNCSHSQEVKWGKSKSGSQRLKCKNCGRTRVENIHYQAYKKDVDRNVVTLLKEGCGIRSISRILRISTNTVQSRILKISRKVKKPSASMCKVYELDELRTFVQRKDNFVWVAYCIRRDTKEVLDFRVGRRTKAMIKPIIDKLLLSNAKRIHTDKLNIYKSLIPKVIHKAKQYSINNIERMNLTLRTHLKRLSRKTLCFSKNQKYLEAQLKIYFWA